MGSNLALATYSFFLFFFLFCLFLQPEMVVSQILTMLTAPLYIGSISVHFCSILFCIFRQYERVVGQICPAPTLSLDLLSEGCAFKAYPGRSFPPFCLFLQPEMFVGQIQTHLQYKCLCFLFFYFIYCFSLLCFIHNALGLSECACVQYRGKRMVEAWCFIHVIVFTMCVQVHV